MSLTSKIWYLKQFELPNYLKDNQLSFIANAMTLKRYKSGEYITLPNAENDKVYFLIKGLVKISNYTEEGGENLKYILHSPEIFGLLSLIDEEGVSDVRLAAEDCLIGVVSTNVMKELMSCNAVFNQYLMRLISRRLRTSERNLEAIKFKDSSARVSQFLYEFAKGYGKQEGTKMIVKNVLTHQDIGKLTFTSRQTVNYIFNRLRRDNIIDYNHREIRIHQPMKLAS